MSQVVKFPFGPADVQTLEDSDTIALSITNAKTIASVSLGQAATINVTVVDDLPVGSELILKITSDATGRDVTCGTNLTGPVIAGASNKTKMAMFVFDGSAFLASAASIQID